MGVEEIYGISPVLIARASLYSSAEATPAAAHEDRTRRNIARERRMMYQDQFSKIVENTVEELFDDATVKTRMKKFAPMATSQSLFRRIVNVTASTAYLVPPVRYIDIADSPAQAIAEATKFAVISNESRLNQRMDLAAKLARACNAAFLYTRYVPRLTRTVIDVMTPDQVTVIPHPDAPQTELAVIYDRLVWDKTINQWVVHHVYWDDEVTFTLNQVGNLASDEPPKNHGLRRIPIVAIHAYERYGGYWDYTTGDDLVQAQKACSILTLLALRKLKARGFRQLVVSGDVRAFPKGQAMDDESAIQTPEGASLSELGSESDADNYLTMIGAIEARVAATRGVSRARLNQETTGDISDDQGLLEQRRETINYMLPAEVDEFDVLKMVSAEGPPEYRLSPDSKVSVDYGEIQHRVDRKTQLEIRDTERKMGLRNIYDDLREDDPEIASDEDAEKELTRNIAVTSKWIGPMRALNQANNASADEPGQSPADNGAMGPAVRDNKMTGDQAAEQAKTGVPPKTIPVVAHERAASPPVSQ